MPGAARLGDLIGHAPPIPPVTAAALIGAALGTTGRLLIGSTGLTSGALAGALSAIGVATEPEPRAGGGDGVGVGGVVTGKIVGPCSGNVFINGIPAARALIDMAVCSLHPPVPIPIVSGSSNVFINGMPAARLGDKSFCGAVNLTASGNVFIGGSAGGSGQTVQVGPVMPEDTAAPLVRASALAAAAGAVPEITTDLFGPNVLADALARNAALAAGLPMSFQATDQPCHSFETERELRAQEIWPHKAPPDGVVSEDPATAYLRRSGAFEPNANTIEAKVGPTIRTAVLAVTPGGPYVLMAEGGHQMGEGIAQVRNGDVVSGGVGIAAGGLTALGGTAVAGAKPKVALNGASGANNALPSEASRATRLVPRVDVTDEFFLKTGKNGSTTLLYGNPEGIHGLIVNVDKRGVLGFDIRAPKGGSSMSNASGTDMFLSAMQRLEQHGVQVNAIRGVWIEGTDSVNAAQYLANLRNGLTPQQAAANTWTGRMAASQGFTKVSIPKTAHGTTTVHFER